MFIQYHKYHKRYVSKHIQADPRLQIAYPADTHALITAEHDFYVIGRFKGITVDERAVLCVELKEVESGRTVRTVTAGLKDHRQGMYVDYEGIESEEPEEILCSSGMPDLVYDPEKPESFWYTWNKAYYTDQVFSALIWGGTYKEEGNICPRDQFGELLEPLSEGEYELSVTLHNPGETIRSAKTICLATGQKEVILSRFSPEEHVALVEQFAREEGFEAYTDPYAGIWDTRFFSIDWPVKAHIEIPNRWHWGDAQEYQSGRVHFFDYNISEPCISYEVELGTMLAGNPQCVDDPRRLVTYYYHGGGPAGHVHERVWEQISAMDSGRYLYLTKQELCFQGQREELLVETVCKVLPVPPVHKSGCRYQIPNRIAALDYEISVVPYPGVYRTLKDQKTGWMCKKEDGSEELLILQSQHRIPVEDTWHGHRIHLKIVAKDCQGVVWDEIYFDVDIEQSARDRQDAAC